MGPILFFDGHCVLCHRSVQWLINRDPHTKLHFASQQNLKAIAWLQQQGISAPTSDSVWLLHNNQLHEYSDAAIVTLSFLKAPWHWGTALRFVPKAWRDAVYKWVANNRYRWFGQYPTCQLPKPEHRSRFLFEESTQ